MSIDSYYYLISALPMLRLGERPVLDSDEFLALAQAHLDEERARQLECVDPVPDGCGCCDAEDKWRAWETYVRNILLRERGGSTEVVHRWHRHEDDVFPGVRRLVEEALNHDNPLQRERMLDELRWKELDALRVTHEFDFEALVIYRLQLFLAEKWARQDAESGMENLNKLVDKLGNEARDKRTVLE
jgi:hypothetical protein